MQGNARETYGSGCKVPGKCRECMCGYKESTDAGECTGITGKRKWVGAMCQGNLGEYQGNV